MARFVREIMNPEALVFPDSARPDDALDRLLDLEITAAPVVDPDGRPIGMTSLRDILRDGARAPTSGPALSVSAGETIDAAARILAESGRHHLVVVGSDGRVAGMVSSLDLLRAVIGLPPRFPATFPHHDGALGVSWTNVTPFDLEHAEAAPAGAGVLVLSSGGVGKSEQDVWAEEASSLRGRLSGLARVPPHDGSELARLLERGDLRFRCTQIEDATTRTRIIRKLQERLERSPLASDAVRAQS